jgi:hypothetical protein
MGLNSVLVIIGTRKAPAAPVWARTQASFR